MATPHPESDIQNYAWTMIEEYKHRGGNVEDMFVVLAATIDSYDSQIAAICMTAIEAAMPERPI